MSRFLSLLCIIFLGLGSFPIDAQVLREARAWMGISIDKGPRGVLVNAVLKGTPAEKAGLAAGDEIFELDGQSVREPEQLINTVQAKGVGHSLSLQLWRKNEKIKKSLALEVQPDTLAMLEKLYVGQAAPDFALKSLADGKTIRKQDLKGKVVLLEFWTTWCPACRAAQPYLSKIARANKKLIMLGITSEEESQVKAFMKGQDFGYPVVFDVDDKVHAAYQVNSLPTFFLIDSQGVVRRVAIGGGRYIEELLHDIGALLKEKN